MTSEGLGEMFEGDSADTFAGKFPLVSMRGRAGDLACADPGARTPIGASGNFPYSFYIFILYKSLKYWPIYLKTKGKFKFTGNFGKHFLLQ